MKKILFLIFFNVGCAQLTNAHFQNDLNESFQQWEKIKELNKSSYQYTIVFSSWLGFGYETTIAINNDQFISRQYQSWDNNRKVIHQWHETSTQELGHHKEGAPLKTIEELYAQCRDEVLTLSKHDNEFYIKFDQQGILEHCTSRNKHCADDCSTGVNIKNLQFN